METKKSKQADLERRRPLWFFSGLAISVLLFVVILEFTTGSNTADVSSDMLDDLVQETELLPAPDQRDMVAAAEPQKKASTQRVNIVDEKTKVEKLNQITEMRTVGDGNGSQSGSSDNSGNSENATADLKPVAVDMGDNPLNFRVVEQLPEFPGGMSSFVKWINDNIKYPYSAQQRGVKGRVVVMFVINRDGSTSDLKVAKSADPVLDREALRVMRMMPHWKPGISNNKPCRTLFAVPIDFNI